MESSVSALMDHLNGVETRRRVVMMRSKEAETRLSFASEEQQQLEKQRAAVESREAELKRELDRLLNEQQQMQLQLMAGADAVRRSEVEESLLIDHVRAQVSRAEGLAAEWRGHGEGLAELQRAWEADGAAAPLQQRMRALDAEALRLCEEKERLERAVREALEARTAGPAGPGAGAAAEEAATIQLREQLAIERRELDEHRAQHARQHAALEREVVDLGGRAEELDKWLTDTENAREQTLRSIGTLRACIAAGLCAACKPT